MSISPDPLLDRLRRRIGPHASSKVEQLVLALADEIKATSNDQNVQRLARDLRAAAPAIARDVSIAGVV